MRRLSLLFLLSLCACKSAPPPPPPLSADELARRAAETFLICYERDGAECRPKEAPLRAFAALHALHLVKSQIPTAIVDTLERALDGAADEDRLRRLLIRTLADNERWARTAGCTATRATPMVDRIDALGKQATDRIERLGLSDSELGARVTALREAAGTVRQARLVEAACRGGARTVLLTMVPTEHGGFVLVDYATETPAWLAAATERDAGRIRLQLDGENLVDRWMPFYEEQL